MDAIALLEQAKGLGLLLTVDGDKLTVTGPKTAEAAALVQRLAPHKPALIALLQTPLQPAPVAIADDLDFTLADVDALPIEPEPPQPAYDAVTTDLTGFVGTVVCDSDMAVLTQRALARNWQLTARRVPAGWRISQLLARWGNIIPIMIMIIMG
ncbi:MAG: hypothetical protein E6Q97_30645 [Desulfurellales bacterium]|nr:MAG: hypothetical protein E6Q97_30645 [Desulfurellales bacterium]